MNLCSMSGPARHMILLALPENLREELSEAHTEAGASRTLTIVTATTPKTTTPP